MRRPIVLASTSPYRRELLEKLGLPFSTAAPDCDETPLVGEQAADLVQRLAYQKAASLQAEYPQHLIIGSDQVAYCNGQIMGKPHTIERAQQQLRELSGQTVTFLTGLAVVDSSQSQHKVCVDRFEVKFRSLTEAEIVRYIELEQPLNCAGSFKSEGLGICLFEALHGDDPNSLIGLPLIRLLEMLRGFGVNPLESA
ncbi:Maf family protein [Pseudidiomarina taiwanensis]|uniref:7-methyl-GTP pyrophosphatase n=1 Tax=Pseudidiomarina taiwanensis TaxID=337250 RepID=A0A432ZNG0_9GAMM|nr:nucleoside triphosphate pyrophosphatase [Pseudidiomarina taiwanensis]RUO79417.1 septum formation inhibitor Maf [Pseudidiomarina taiwanensis]